MLRLTQARSLVVVCSAGALRVIVDLGLDNKALTDKKKGADSEKMGGNNLFLIARNEDIETYCSTIPHERARERTSDKEAPKVGCS